jgi:hypothetical protein
MAIYMAPKPVYINYIERKLPLMTLTQAKINFQAADHQYQMAWANGDPTLLREAIRTRKAAFNKVAKLVKQAM